MFIPKKYGQSKIDKCPFCGKQATIFNKQNVPVCPSHKNEKIGDLKCVCGSTLELMNGKFGIFFSCIKCGNMNLRKVMEFNTVNPRSNSQNSQLENEKSQNNKVMTVRSDDPRYFD